MCGLAVAVGRVPDRLQADLVVESLRRRGPDAELTKSLGNVTLYFQRLALENRSAAVTDLVIQQEGAVLLNGEIWNYRELATAEGLDVASEYELIWQLYRRYSASAFSRLHGMFGIVVVDTTRQLIVACRDEIGIKPLFWGTTANSLALGSTIRSVTSLGADCSPDRRFLAELTAVGFGAAGSTPINGVAEVLPGHTYTWDVRAVQLGPNVVPFAASDGLPVGTDAVDCVLQLLSAALGRCLEHSDDTRPVLMLSGGLDSTLLAFLLREVGLLDAADFVFVGDQASPDLPFARLVADCLGIDLVTTPPSTTLSEEEGTIAGGGYTGRRLASVMAAIRASAPGCRVLLCGEGSDELFAGYPWNVDPRRRLRSLRATTQTLPGDSVARQRLTELARSTSVTDSLASVRHVLLGLDQAELLQRHHLLPLDQTSMHFGMELRVPYLDTDHWRFARRIPATMHWRDGAGKAVVREALRRVAPELPPSFISRTKVGLPSASGTVRDSITAAATNYATLLQQESRLRVRAR